MKNNEDKKITLKFKSENLNPEYISSLTKLKPSKYAKKNDRYKIGKMEGIHDCGFWEIKLSSVDDVFKYFGAIIPKLKEEFKDLKIKLWLAIIDNSGQANFAFKPEILKNLGELGIHLWISCYYGYDK